MVKKSESKVLLKELLAIESPVEFITRIHRTDSEVMRGLVNNIKDDELHVFMSKFKTAWDIVHDKEQLWKE